MLLLDEPLGALDAKLRKELQLELTGLQREVGITFVYVTHDQEEALTMSDRLAVMREGEVEQIGSPREIYENPTSVYVADFLGVANLLPAEHLGGGRVRVVGTDVQAQRRRRRARRAATSSCAPSGCASCRPGTGGDNTVRCRVEQTGVRRPDHPGAPRAPTAMP